MFLVNKYQLWEFDKYQCAYVNYNKTFLSSTANDEWWNRYPTQIQTKSKFAMFVIFI